MLSGGGEDGPFINLARLNLPKYASRPNLAKSLFEYIFHHENDVRNVSGSVINCLLKYSLNENEVAVYRGSYADVLYSSRPFSSQLCFT